MEKYTGKHRVQEAALRRSNNAGLKISAVLFLQLKCNPYFYAEPCNENTTCLFHSKLYSYVHQAIRAARWESSVLPQPGVKSSKNMGNRCLWTEFTQKPSKSPSEVYWNNLNNYKKKLKNVKIPSDPKASFLLLNEHNIHALNTMVIPLMQPMYNVHLCIQKICQKKINADIRDIVWSPIIKNIPMH